jgi:chromosome segregation ATPase
VDDLPKIANMIRNASAVSYDAQKMMDFISGHEARLKQQSELEEELKTKRSAIEDANVEIESAEAQLRILRASISQLEAAIKKSIDEYVEQLKKTVAALKKLEDTSVANVDAKIKEISTSVTTEMASIDSALKKATPVIQDFSKVIKEADEAAARVARDGTVLSLFQLVKDGSGTEVQVLTILFQLLSGFKSGWMDTRLGIKKTS